MPRIKGVPREVTALEVLSQDETQRYGIMFRSNQALVRPWCAIHIGAYEDVKFFATSTEAYRWILERELRDIGRARKIAQARA